MEMNHKDTIPLSRYTKELTDVHPFVFFLRLCGLFCIQPDRCHIGGCIEAGFFASMV